MSPNKILVGHGPPDDCQPVIVSGQIAFEARKKIIQHGHCCTYTKETGKRAGAYRSWTGRFQPPAGFGEVHDGFSSIPVREFRFSLWQCELALIGGAG